MNKYKKGGTKPGGGGYWISVPDTPSLCIYAGCPGLKESARIKCRRANEKLFDRERNVSSDGGSRGCTRGENGNWLIALGIQDVIMSGNEDRRKGTKRGKRTMRRDFMRRQIQTRVL